MPQYVDVGGSIVEFPDGMSNADIAAAIRRTAQPKAPAFDPTDGMSGMQKFLAGTGKAFANIGLGARQMLGLANQAEVDERRQLDAPLMRTGAGLAGNIVGNIGLAAPTALIPGANTMTGAALTGAAMNALQPLDADQSRIGQAAIGAGLGAASQAGANAIGRALKPVQATQTPTQTAMIAQAQQMGIPLNVAQQTGSKPLAWIDSALDNLPFTAERQAVAKQGQRDIWQRAVLGQLGEQADTATPDVLGRAYNRLGNEFRALSARNTVDVGTNDFINAIARIDASQTPFSKGVSSVIDNALDLASKGKIGGDEYQKVRSSLTQASKGAWAQNPELGQALKGLRNALDDAAEQSMSAADRDAWQAVRAQYAALKTVEKATDSASGNISPKKLFNELQRANPQGMRYGFGNQELPDMARVGKAFIAEQLPDSGTAQRSWYMQMLQNPTAGIGGLLGFASGGPAGAAIGAAAGAATPLAAQRALWGNSRYLTNGLLDPAITRAVGRPVLTGMGVSLLPELAE